MRKEYMRKSKKKKSKAGPMEYENEKRAKSKLAQQIERELDEEIAEIDSALNRWRIK